VKIQNTVFESAIAEITEVPTGDYKNPFLTLAKFVFADDKGNKNRQGIELEDFPAVALSAIDMPVKMKFKGDGPDSHLGSIPIGHIKSMETIQNEDGVNQLIAWAALYNAEYPDEITYIKEKHAEGKAPGLSWELVYNASVMRDGVEWLKGIVTKAATFVRSPAYGSRTHLMALASTSGEDSSLVELAKEILAQAKETETEGGNQVNEEELKKLQTELTEAKEAAKDAEASKESEITRLNGLLEDKDKEISSLTEKVEGMQRAALIEERTQKIVSAGLTLEADAEKLGKKKEFWASLSDDAFEEYLSDLLAAKASAKPASASIQDRLPKLTATAEDAAIDVNALKADLKSVARN
jgi:hypothetical protein